VNNAEKSATSFVSGSSLSGTIQQSNFQSGQITFFLSNDFCFPNHLLNSLGVRIWQVKNKTLAQSDVVTQFKTGLGPTLTKLPGFLEYGGVVLSTDKTMVFFWNVFTNSTTTAAAAAAATAFVTGGSLATQIELIYFSSGDIVFDYYVQPGNSGIDGVGIALIVFVIIAVILGILLIYMLLKKGETYHGAP